MKPESTSNGRLARPAVTGHAEFQKVVTGVWPNGSPRLQVTNTKLYCTYPVRDPHILQNQTCVHLGGNQVIYMYCIYPVRHQHILDPCVYMEEGVWVWWGRAGGYPHT